MTDIQNNIIGIKLKEFLESKNLSIYKFSNKVGTSRQNIYNAIENGDFKFSLYLSMVKEFPDIVNYLGVPSSIPSVNEPQGIYKTQHRIVKEGDDPVIALLNTIQQQNEIILRLSQSVENLSKNGKNS